jgi:hypothetical protein
MVGQRASQAFAALQEIAGRYAGRVARLWPTPYVVYRGLPAARRHLAHIAMPRTGCDQALNDRAFARDIETLRTRELLARWAPGAPPGLENALGKLGERAWTPGVYRRLLAVLREGGPAAATLRHAASIDIWLIEVLELLPAALRGPATARWVRGSWEARLVDEAVALAATLAGGAARADALVERLGRAKDRARFFEMLVDELRPVALAEPVRETAELRPLRTVGEVRDAGRRFRNCLGDCVHRAVFGASAFVEWRGAEPAVVELQHEGAAGWRLVTVLGVANAAVRPDTARLVREALAAQGVRSGFGAELLLSEIDAIVEDERQVAERAQADAAIAVAAE